MKRKTVKQAIAILLLSAVALSLTGCWDRTEIDELGYILAIGIDKASIGNNYTFWLGVPRKLVPASSGGGGGGDAGKVHVLTVNAPDLNSAMNLTNTWIARRLTLEHAKALVLGESLARQDIFTALAPAARFREFRRNMLIIITRGTAEEYLKNNQPSIEENPARWIELMAEHQSLTGFVNRSTIQDFFLDSESLSALPVVILAGNNAASQQGKDGGDAGAKAQSGGQAGGGGGTTGGGPSDGGQANLGTPNGLPANMDPGSYLPGTIPRTGGDPIEMIGGAVFNGNKMVATLTGSEVRILLILRGDFARAYYPVPDPLRQGYYVAIDTRQARKPKIEITYEGTTPHIDVTITLEGDLVGIESTHDYTEPSQMAILERAIEKNVTDKINALVARSQTDIGGDVFRFGDHARSHFWTWPEWADYKWQEKYLKATVTPHVKFSFRRVGLQFTPPALPTERPQPPQQRPQGGGQGGATGGQPGRQPGGGALGGSTGGTPGTSTDSGAGGGGQ